MATPGAGSGPSWEETRQAIIELNKQKKLFAQALRNKLQQLGITPPPYAKIEDLGDFQFELQRDRLHQEDKHIAFARSLGMPITSAPGDLLKEFGRRTQLQIQAAEKAAALKSQNEARKMGEYHEKKMKNIKKIEENIAREQMKEIEDFLAEPNSPKESKNIKALLRKPTPSTAAATASRKIHKQDMKNIQRARNNAAAATRKNTGLATLLEKYGKSEAKLASQLRMETGLPQSKYMNRIANTLGKPRGLPPAVYLKALRNQHGVPEGMTLREFAGQTRKAGGKRKNKNRNRKTRRRV